MEHAKVLSFYVVFLAVWIEDPPLEVVSVSACESDIARVGAVLTRRYESRANIRLWLALHKDLAFRVAEDPMVYVLIQQSDFSLYLLL